MKIETKLHWESLLIIWLWHVTTDVVNDDVAWIHLLRCKAWVTEALRVLERESSTE